ncbi:MAG: hypothetical protein J5I47_10970 [Vicingus serpentipes]|nr:hypothetical protein [Vicingus serpentipes]
MKTVKRLIFIATFLMSVSAFSQGEKIGVVTPEGDTIASINNGGVIENTEKIKTGKVLPNGKIQDAQDQQIGTIENNEIKNSSGVVIGKLNIIDQEKVELLDAENKVIATLFAGMMVYGSDGSLALNFSKPTSNETLAAYFLFFNN